MGGNLSHILFDFDGFVGRRDGGGERERGEQDRRG